MKRLRLRREPATPADGDARALAAANKRIVELETSVTVLTHKLNRASAGPCCTAADQLDTAVWARERAEDDLVMTHARLRDVLAQMRRLSAADHTAPLVLPVFRDREG